ncbi:hypothetical protein PR202_ga05597 [Eleusine coracana subsp. coracana]|uniref:ubiquitinyl hydrolase 1 n=1 Tax=Eleusine coracana subsp. coracana TaxID=191504 RepID=A0AAV5BUR1_ELECO|nr:hypothetical protein PR202_ga05143 [Eleusine coracana subsp. coracana]GJM89405.1 hypothetical protein PR202_ga05597 [Eleusine coracana subsp. coracana]
MSWWRRRRRFVEWRRRRRTLGCPAAALSLPQPPPGAGDGPDRGAVFAAASFAAPSHRSATGVEEPGQHLLSQQRPPVPRFHASPRHVLPRLVALQSVCLLVGKKVFPNRDKECSFCVLERQIARLLRTEAGALESPGKIIRCLPLFAEHFRWGRQEDAHEFLRYIVDACHTAGLRIRKRLAAASANGNCGEEEGRGQGSCMVMKETFGGALLSQVKCLVCKGESNKTDEIMDLSLDLPGSSSVGDALARFFKPEILEGANKYSCERCKKLTSARKQMFILRAPKVLVIQLKRFEGINGGKINRNIEFKEALVLSDFIYKKNQVSQPVYNLFGSIVHSGLSPESGHYYAYVKDVLSEKVYILFYILSSKTQKPCTNGYSSAAAKSFSTNGNGISSTTSSEALKVPLVEQDGLCSVKSNRMLPMKNGKMASGPHIKPIHLKNNSKVNLTSRSNLGVNGSAVLSELNGCKTEKLVESSKKSVNGSISCEKMDENSERIQQDANGNGHTTHVQCHVETINTVATCFLQCSVQSPDPVASKNSVLRQEDPANSVKDVVNSSKHSASLKHQRDEEKLKEMLYDSFSSELRSSGWVDDVYNFMRAGKRRRIQNTDTPQDIDAMR